MRALFSIGRYYSTALMHVGIVINPIAGRRGRRSGEGERRRAFAQSSAAAFGVTATIVMTEGRGHARDLAQAFVDAGCDTVVAMGGDGTVNEVAQALVDTATPLGILPCGSGDGFAKGLGLPSHPHRAMRVALTATPEPVDVGDASGRLFLNIAGTGFDAAVAHRFATGGKRGVAGYLSAGSRLLWGYAPPEYEVRWQTGMAEEVRRGRKFLIAFANAPSYGNGAVLAPDASVRDGVLDLVLVEAGGPLRQMWRARRLFANHRQSAGGIERHRVIHAVIRASSPDDALVCHVDGEPFEAPGLLEVSVRPKALLVRAGRTTPLTRPLTRPTRRGAAE